MFFASTLLLAMAPKIGIAQPPPRAGEREIRGGLQGSGRVVETEGQDSKKVPSDRLLRDILSAEPLSDKLSKPVRNQLGEITKLLSEGNTEDARAAWQNLIASLPKEDKSPVESWIAHIVREGTLKGSRDLLTTAEDLRLLESQDAVVSAHLASLEELLAGLAADQKVVVQDIEIEVGDTESVPSTLEPREMTRSGLESLIESWEAMKLRSMDCLGQARVRLNDAIESHEPELKRLREDLALLRGVLRKFRK